MDERGAARLAGWFAVRLVGWFAARLVGWLVARLVGWFAAFHPPPNLPLEGGRDELGKGRSLVARVGSCPRGNDGFAGAAGILGMF